jgi:hypothetical protein
MVDTIRGVLHRRQVKQKPEWIRQKTLTTGATALKSRSNSFWRLSSRANE